MKKLLVLTLLFAILLPLFSCNVNNNTSESPYSDEKIIINEVTDQQKVLLKNLAAEWDSNSTVSKDSDFRLRQYDFALKLYRAFSITSENENVMLSPLSIQLALAMAANGAKGETKSEMENFLGGVPIEQLNSELKSFVTSLPSANDYKLGISNSIWMCKDTVEVKENFLNVNTNYYNSELYTEPFDDSTADKINNWVNEKTDGMIEKIVDQVDQGQLLHLINAIVFDAKWNTPIDVYSVKEDEFTTISGDKKKVEMMSTEEYEYIITDDAVGFVKQYKNNKYSFIGILPNENISINDYIASLDALKLCDILDNIQRGQAAIKFPKFECEYSLQLKSLLSAMGMPKAFTDSADFTDMATSPHGNVSIDSVLHKTYISVDNEGTRAAAVTDIYCRATGMPVYNLTATFDRPFVYMIIENETKLPIFIGTVMDIGE